VVLSGSADEAYETITLQGVASGLVLRRKAACSCACIDEPDCSTMHCIGPDLGAQVGAFVAEHVVGRPWAVFVHGGVFRLYNPIDGCLTQFCFGASRLWCDLIQSDLGAIGSPQETTRC